MGLQMSLLAGADTAASGTKNTGVTGVDDPTGATAATGVSQTGNEGGTQATEQQPEQPKEAEPQQKREQIDPCGIKPNWDTLKPWVHPPRITKSLLTPEEKIKFQGHVDVIFDKETLMGCKIAFHPQDVMEVLMKVRVYLKSEPMLIEDLPFDITVVADIHGQLYDLDRVFKCENGGKKGWENMKYLFLGDYVDRGRHSIEVVMALFCLKMLYPDNIFLLRGNHEFLMTNVKYGFCTAFGERYDYKDALLMYLMANETFAWLSIAAIVGDTYFCAHGGVSPAGFTRQQFRGVFKPIYQSSDDLLVHDVCWADPAQGLRGTSYNKDRMTSVYFGFDYLAHAIYNLDVKVVIRGHTMLKAGYELAWHCVFSIFTATAVDENMNNGAIAYIDARGKLSITVLVVNPARTAWEAKLREKKKMEPDEKTTMGVPDEEDGNKTGLIPRAPKV